MTSAVEALRDLPGVAEALDARAAERDFDAERAAMQDEANAVVVPLRSSVDTTGIRWLSVAELAAPLPPIPWLCEPLRLAPGGVVMVAGYGYSRKTLALQDAALSVAAGLPVWGVHACRTGPVAHLDYEQGRRLTTERYQRMARARGYELASLAEGQLRVECFPSLYLDGNPRRVEDALLRACDGCVFILIDSLRACLPSGDENSSEIRRPLDLLSRVSERLGAVVAVVHHANKPPSDGSERQAKHSVRGSGALFDACAGMFIFDGKKGEPTKVKHEKERITGAPVGDFGLDALDIPSGDDPRWGLEIQHMDLAQLGARKPKETATLDKWGALVERVLTTVAATPNVSLRRLRAVIGGSRERVDEALLELERTGKIVCDRAGKEGVSDAYRIAL